MSKAPLYIAGVVGVGALAAAIWYARRKKKEEAGVTLEPVYAQTPPEPSTDPVVEVVQPPSVVPVAPTPQPLPDPILPGLEPVPTRLPMPMRTLPTGM